MFFHTCTFHKIQDGELKNINMREYDNWESNMGLQFWLQVTDDTAPPWLKKVVRKLSKERHGEIVNQFNSYNFRNFFKNVRIPKIW